MSTLSSDEWAAWIQVGGTLLAIGAAIWIASRQHRIELARQESKRAEQARRTARLCTIFGTQAVECVAEMVRACTYSSRDLLSQQLSRLKEVIEFSRAVDIAEVRDDALWPFMSLRVAAAQSQTYAEELVAQPALSFGQWEYRFDKLHSEASTANLMLAAAFGDEEAKRIIEEERIAATTSDVV